MTPILLHKARARTPWHYFGSYFDHATVSVEVSLTEVVDRGRSYPKLFKTDITRPQDREWLRAQIAEIELQMMEHWNPHTKLEFLKLMIRSKTLELRQMRKRENNSEALRNQIDDLTSSMNNSNGAVVAQQLESLKRQLYQSDELEQDFLRRKAAIKWREEGERSTKYFLARFKANVESTTIYLLRQVDGKLTSNLAAVRRLVADFYRRLYSNVGTHQFEDADYVQDFFVNCPRIEPDHRMTMAKPMTVEELKSALHTCKDSAPGLDGIPYSFYKSFADPLLQYVVDSWQHALSVGELAVSHRQSCITLLPKKGKDLTNIANWRPISLSACDLKIITKAYANRLKPILANTLSEPQAAYVPGRDISFNSRILQLAKSYARKEYLDYCVVSLDAKKAFDSVSHEYLQKVLEIYDFPPEFIKVFRTLYKGLESVVQVNGFLSSPFDIKRGVKQGDALSCGLFVLAMDPLIRNLINNPEIEGLPIPIGDGEAEEIKVLGYADDICVVCKNSSLQPIFSEYEKLGKLSGLTLNAEKTEVLNLIHSDILVSEVTYFDQIFQLGRVQQIKICGITIAQDEITEYQANVLDRITIMEQIALSWGRRSISLNGRMMLAKSFILSQIVFPAQVCVVKPKEIKRIEKLIYAFVNGSKDLYGPERIARKYLKPQKCRGGINGIDVECYLESIIVKQYNKAKEQCKLLAKIQLSFIAPKDSIGSVASLLLRNHYSDALRNANLDLNEIEVISGIPLINLLKERTRAYELVSQLNISSLWQLQDLINYGNRPRSFYYSVLRSLPTCVSTLVRAREITDSPLKLVWMIDGKFSLFNKNNNRLIKKSMINKKLALNSVNLGQIYKRTDWLREDCEVELWSKALWDIKNPKLLAYRLKVIYKDIFSNERRYRFGIADSPACSICGQVETVEHQLYLCQNAQEKWRLFSQLTGIHIGSFVEVVRCYQMPAIELVKSIFIKSLIQIDRSQDSHPLVMMAECSTFLQIEIESAGTPGSRADSIKELLEKTHCLRDSLTRLPRQ